MSSVETGAGGPRVWSVGALLLAVGDAVQARLGACTVRGELSGFTRAPSGHCYFTLKDSEGNIAMLRCAMFRRAASMLAFAPRDGQQVELRGRMAVYEARGELQFVAESMRAAGAGALYEEFLRLKARLAAQGLFDAERKRAVAAHPAALGIVTSTAAAALRDVLTCLQRRAPHVRVVVYPSAVQGAEAPAALAAAIGLAGQRAEVDTLLVCRGGGSLEDLWAFNDERVVRAVTDCPVPVIVGVGHETDITLADLAADLRAPTPTAAAELAAAARDELLDELHAFAHRLLRAQRRQFDNHAQRVDRTALRLAKPGRVVEQHRQRLTSLDHRSIGALRGALAAGRHAPQARADRLMRAVRARLEREARRVDTAAHRLQALDPRRVLARGYAWVTDEEGHALVSARQLVPGQRVTAVWADGSARADVVDVRIDPSP